MRYGQIFSDAIARLHDERRYRVFVDILRDRGAYAGASLPISLARRVRCS